MKHFKLLVSLCVLWSALPIQAATYSGGKTAWRVPGGKWSPARIEVGNGLVEVHAVRGGLQASFNKDNFSPLEVGGFAGTGTEKKARWGVRIAGLAILTGSLLFLDSRMAQKREEEDLLCSGDRFDSDPCLDAQEKIDYGGLFTVAGGGFIGLVMGTSSSKHPFFILFDGIRKVEVRVPKKESSRLRNDIQAAFSESLKRIF